MHPLRRLVLLLSLPLVLGGAVGAGDWTRVGVLQVQGRRPGAPLVRHEKLDGGRELLTIDFRSYEIWEFRALRQNWIHFEVPGCGLSGDLGQPWAAKWSTIVKKAPREQILLEKVEYEWSGKQQYGRFFPTQRRRPDGSWPDLPQVDEEAYQHPGDYFEGWRFSMSEPRRIWNDHYLTLNLRPFRYFPAEGRIGFVKKARIHLRRVGGHAEDTPGVDRRQKKHASFMVITPERFLETLRPYLAFKRKAHPDLEVRTLEEIGDTVEDIDRVIEKAGSRGTGAFLLVGHSTILPAAPFDQAWDDDDIPDCFDSDSVYRNQGENPFPSYKVGRFPVTTEKELASVVRKTLRKLRYPDTYRTHPMLVAHEEQAPRKYQGCVNDILETVVPHSKIDLEPRLVFPAPRDRGGLGSRLDDFYQGMQKGVGVLLYRGHGGTDFLATKYLGYWGAHQSDWYELETAVPPVFYSIACLNGQMTDEKRERVFGLCENLITADSQGVSGAIGAIMPSPTTPNHTFAWYLMHYTYVKPQGTLGEILERSLISTMKYGFENSEWSGSYLSMGELYNLYGDPELPVVGP